MPSALRAFAVDMQRNVKARPNRCTGGLGLTRRPSSATKKCLQLEDRGSSSALSLADLAPLRGRATASIGTCCSGSVSKSSVPWRSRPTWQRPTPGASVFPTGCGALINMASCPSGLVTAFGPDRCRRSLRCLRAPMARTASRCGSCAHAPNGMRGRGGRGTPRSRRAARPADGRRPGKRGACPAAAGPPARRPGRRSRVGADVWRPYNGVGPEGGLQCPAGADPP